MVALWFIQFPCNIEKILNRPITKFYNSDDVNVIAGEVWLTSFTRNKIFYKKHGQHMLIKF